MSRVISNLLLSLSMIPLGFGVFFLTALILDEAAGMSDDAASTVASIFLLVFVVVYWTCVWASSFTWNGSLVLRTIAALASALGVGVVVIWIVFAAVGTHDVEVAAALGSMAASTAWMIFSALAWRETAADREARLSKVTTAGGAAGFAGVLLCPSCGYNMKGLTQARCPECGTEYTLDSLLAANVERTAPERELGTRPT